jgi:predicted glycosyltransferase involved in capsule biosynthesis
MKSTFDTVARTTFDYRKLVASRSFGIGTSGDLTVVIPARSRASFLKPTIRCFKAAEQLLLESANPKRINYVLVEYSHQREHEDSCKDLGIGYIWIASRPDQQFNKCLAMNCGAVAFPTSSFYLFHDIDCLVQRSFFVDLFDNIKARDCRAIQAFYGRRLLYLNKSATECAIAGALNVDDIDASTPGIVVGPAGAPGGSIAIDRELFIEVGGFDDELFAGYAPEDRFFWNKLELLTKVDTAHNPVIEMVHMHHESAIGTNPLRSQYIKTCAEFDAAKHADKMRLLTMKKSKLIPHITAETIRSS